jgi:hypothetical protein
VPNQVVKSSIASPTKRHTNIAGDSSWRQISSSFPSFRACHRQSQLLNFLCLALRHSLLATHGKKTDYLRTMCRSGRMARNLALRSNHETSPREGCRRNALSHPETEWRREWPMWASAGNLSGCRTAVELAGSVTPTNYKGSIILRRIMIRAGALTPIVRCACQWPSH